MSYRIDWNDDISFMKDETPSGLEYAIDYKDWKKYMIPDIKKLNKLAIEYILKCYYHVSNSIGADVKFVDRPQQEFMYNGYYMIYNIPLKTDVKEIIQYIRNAGGRKYIGYAEIYYFTNYKYVLHLYTSYFSIPISKIKRFSIDEKKAESIYDYKTAVKKFGYFDSSKIYNMINKAWNETNDIYIAYRKQYKIRFSVSDSYADYIYKIINIHSDKIHKYVKQLQENLYILEKIKDNYNKYITNAVIINDSTVKINIAHQRHYD
jgi:hypothetical protein